MPGLSAFTQTLMRMPPGASTGEAAIALASAGVPVFPVAVNGKQPLTRHGFHDATTSHAQVRDWWASTPGANVGMPTGARSGVVVVDVDVHGTANGYVALDRAERAGLLAGGGKPSSRRPVTGSTPTTQPPRAPNSDRGRSHGLASTSAATADTSSSLRPAESSTASAASTGWSR